MSYDMVGPLILLMASIATNASAPKAAESSSAFRPIGGVTATATVSIRIISGVRFGSDHLDGGNAASRRKAQLTDAAGNSRDAELLEFQ